MAFVPSRAQLPLVVALAAVTPALARAQFPDSSRGASAEHDEPAAATAVPHEATALTAEPPPASEGETAAGPSEPPGETPADAAIDDPAAGADAPVTQLELQTVNDDINGLRTDVENFKFQWQRERDIHTAITTRYLLLGGNVQARFWWTDVADDTAPSLGKKTAFDVPTAQVNLTGSLYRDYEEGRNLTYAISFGVSQQAGTNNSWLNLQNANVAYSFLPTSNGPEAPKLTITVGQQLIPFGLEAQASEELRPVIRNAQFTQSGGGGLGLTRREIGAIVRGDLFPLVDFGYNFRVPVLEYALGVVNGAGPNNPDDNNKKDLIARLAFTLPTEFNSWLRQFTVGGTVYYGRQNLSIKNPADASKNIPVGTGKRERYGLDVYYNHWPFGVTYEFVVGKDETATGTRENLVRYVRESQAHTATFFLSFGEQFVASFRNQGRFDDWWPKTYQPFLRFDRFNADTDKPGDKVTTYTAGFNLFFAETTKFQLNYNLRYDNALYQTEGWTHEALSQLQFGF